MNLTAAELVPVLGWALIDFVWQGALLALVLVPALALLRDARPQARYAVAMAGLLACVLLPLVSVLGALADDGAAVGGASAQFFASAVATDGAATTGGPWRASLQAYLPWIVAAWSAGAAIFALRLALGCAWVSRQRVRATAAPDDWQARLDRLSSRMGLRRAPRLRLADAFDGPAVAGCWRPVVLVPAAVLAAMPVDLLEALLAHELAHVRRHDYLLNLVQNAIETLLFYHPVVWWLSRRIRIEREQIADDLALSAIAEPRRLARALQQLDRLQQTARHPSSHLVTAAHGGNLMKRIQRLVLPAASSGRSSLLPLVAVAALCLSVYAQATSRGSQPAPIVPAGAIAATPAPKATPTMLATPATKVISSTNAASATRPRDREDEFTYALVRQGDDDMMVSGHSDDMTGIRQLRERVGGDFLWFRRDGDGFLVRDPTLLAEARAAWAPAQALGARMEALGEQMRPHSERMERLGKQMEAISGRGEPDHRQLLELGQRMQPLVERQRELAGQMQVLAGRMGQQRDEAAREALAGEMNALEAQMRPLDGQISRHGDEMSERGRQLQARHAPLEALGRQMEQASAPMQELGERMGVLGKQQEALSHDADARVRQLLERAAREGKVEPAPAASAR
jgi:beta-lactamase regulating signal transducer with metallopeptidase domain/predicted  nucleic acid-binding Zn-ribbon protein